MTKEYLLMTNKALHINSFSNKSVDSLSCSFESAFVFGFHLVSLFSRPKSQEVIFELEEYAADSSDHRGRTECFFLTSHCSLMIRITKSQSFVCFFFF